MNGVLFMFMGWKAQQCKDVSLSQIDCASYLFIAP